MKLSKLEKYFEVEKLVFNSLDLALYNVSAVVERQEYMITDERGERIKHHNLLALQQRFQNVKAKKQVVRQSSAYDEMIGGPVKGSNEMEVSLGDNKLY
ncbi:MAG: DUF6482 family protein [Pseudoalteromonas spongiae]